MPMSPERRCTLESWRPANRAVRARAAYSRRWRSSASGRASWSDESLVWAHPPPALLPQLVQLLEATPSASAIVCVPHWPGSPWFRPLAELSAEMLLFPPGSLQRVAFDAPALLAQWSVAAFRVLPR